MSSGERKRKATLSVEQIQGLKKNEVLELLKENLSFDDDDLKEIKNLKGLHLMNAIYAYIATINNKGTLQTAHQVTVASLLKNEKITNEDVAEAIAYWLANEFIDNDNLLSDKYSERIIRRRYIPFKHLNSEVKEYTVLEFTDEELFLLGEIEQLELKDLSQATYGIDPFWFKTKLLNRVEAEREIIEVGEKQFKCCQQQEITKQNLTFMIAKGGSGSGKTRILSEVVKILKKASPTNIFKNASVIYYNFTNGFLLTTDERDQNLISMISSRIIFAAFKNTGFVLSKMSKITNNNFLFEILHIISLKLHDNLKVNQNTPIPLVIAFDEYQYAARSIDNLNTSLQYVVGYFMRKLQKAQGLILYPILGGVLLDSEVNFEPTNYSCRLISLPLFRPEDIEILIEEEKVKEFYTPKYQAFWNLVGVVPRHLQWAIEFAKELQQKGTDMPLETKISIIYEGMVKNMYNMYRTSELLDTYCYLTTLTLSGFKYFNETKYSSKVNELVSQGKIYKIGDHIGLPPSFIDIFSRSNDMIPKSLLHDLIITSNKTECEKFGALYLKTITGKLNYLFKFTEPKYSDLPQQFTVGNIFIGAHMSEELASMEISSSVTGTLYFKYTTTSEVMSKIIKKPNLSKIVKLHENEKGIDGFLPELIADDKKLLFVTLNKFVNVDSQETFKMTLKELKSFYEDALLSATGYEVYVVIFTNKKISEKTAKTIRGGTMCCNRLIVVW
ncbi:hypothetical protein ABK040_000373 [Willaertia magna]